MQIWDPEAMVALGGFPRFAAKFKSNKGSLARHICHWMNLCKTVERKALLCLCYWLWVKSTFGLLPTQSLWSPTQLCEFDTDLDNSMVLPEMWLGSGLIASILHQFCSYFKEIFNIKLCQCKELCFSSVSQTIWHGWSHHFSSWHEPQICWKGKGRNSV